MKSKKEAQIITLFRTIAILAAVPSLQTKKMIKGGRTYPANVTPKFSILNPEYTYSVPKYQMISGIFDTLSHLMGSISSERMTTLPTISLNAYWNPSSTVHGLR